MSEGTWGGGPKLDKCIERLFELAKEAGFDVRLKLVKPKGAVKK